MANNVIKINRAPVMTLWAVVVAERLGYEPDTALSLGKAVAGLNAQSKGRAIGIYKGGGEGGKPGEAAGEAPEPDFVYLLGRPVPTVDTEQGLRASIREKVVESEPVETYLTKKFGDDLDAVRAAMQQLAAAFEPGELADQAYQLYEKFRPSIPKGKRGWGAAGDLDLATLRALAKQ